MNQPAWVITPAELKTSLGKVVLLDVRDPEEYQESRIEGSKLIPLDELQDRALTELKKEDDIVIYCGAGIRSMQALMSLKMLGFTKLRSLEGGICAWQDFIHS